MKIAVYGSLLSGMGNHGLLKTSRLLHNNLTVRGTLYSLGGYPGLKLTGNTSVKIEVYEVDEATLRRLDNLEGHPSFYRRTPYCLLTEVGTYEFEIYEWQGTPNKQPVVTSGDWKKWYCEGERF